MNKDGRHVGVPDKANRHTLFGEAEVSIVLIANLAEISGIDQIGVGDDKISHHGGERELA